jgi:tetratricopeptide (TPR) repeat protein
MAMRKVLLAAGAVIALAGGSAFASPLDDAKSALAALDKGDNATAIRLFTSALDSGRLTRSDQELAYVKRAEAYLASSDNQAALADANRALDIDPRDSEAVATRDRVQARLSPPVTPTPAVTPAVTKAANADYEAAVAKYEAQKKADADDYAQKVATYDAAIKAQEAQREADLAAWRADVAACKAGDTSKCATPEPLPAPAPEKPRLVATQPNAVATQVKAKTDAKPPVVTKPSDAPPVERPITY